jgi:hypothetical protein
MERQVVEPDVEQEPEPGVDLLEDRISDYPIPIRDRHRREGGGNLTMDMEESWLMLWPSTVTASVKGLSLAPSQAGHGTSRM